VKDDEEFIYVATPTTSRASQGSSSADLKAQPDIICNQEEFDECVNAWPYDLGLED